MKEIPWRRACALVLLVGAALMMNAQSAQRVAASYALAGEMPRGALLYLQVSDWPAALRAWQTSELKSRYEQSLNYEQLWSRHLLNKLQSRWEEFNAAAGFEIGAAVLATLADERAALAVYDIGRLELVWLAPMSKTASAFVQRQDNFEERETADGTKYFLQAVEADRGRQKQELAFAVARDRFVLATSERWLVRALACVNKPNGKDALSAEPKFNALSRSLTPHFAAVWVDQERLNQDWYFRHYWVMDNVAELKQLRAGLFELERQNERWIERREFLTNEQTGLAALPALPRAAWQRVAPMLPADAPYAQARACAGANAMLVRDIRDALFSRLEAPVTSQTVQAAGWRWRRYRDYERYDIAEGELGEVDDYSNYGWLDYRYHQTIDDAEEAGEENGETQLAALRDAGERRFVETLQRALQAARPEMQVRVQRPRALAAPLLANFQQGVIVSLAQPLALDRAALEAALIELATSRLMLAGTRAALAWQARGEWRELPLPWLGRRLVYAVRGQELLLGNSDELLRDCLAAPANHRGAVLPQAETGELTIIRFSERARAFDPIFATLDAPLVKAYWQERRGKDYTGQEASQEFFSGNVASLLDVAAPVRAMIVQRQMAKGRWREEIALVIANER